MIKTSKDSIEITVSSKFPENTNYKARITPNEGYAPGRLNQSNGVLKSDTFIYATDAVRNTKSILLESYNHQKINVSTYDNKNNITKTYQGERVVTLPIGTKYDVSVMTDFGYTPGTLVNYTKSNSHYRLYTNKYFKTVTDAIPIKCTMKVPKTPGYELTIYTIHGIFKSSETKDSNFSIYYDDYYYIALTKNNGYNVTINNQNFNTKYYMNNNNPLFTVSNMSITLPITATIKTYTVTINTPANETITATNTSTNKTNTSTFTANHGDIYSYKVTPASNAYTPGKVFITSTNTKEYLTQEIPVTQNITVTATPAHKIITASIIAVMNDDKSEHTLWSVSDDNYYIKSDHLVFRNESNTNMADLVYTASPSLNYEQNTDNSISIISKQS